MQLKEYQHQTLRDLELYIETLNNSKSLAVAYSQYWADKGVSLNSLTNNYLHPYINSVNGVPRVTLKVPTAGGKTFIACNAIKRIMDKLQTGAPNQVVAWFVPSDTILKQTLEKLQDVSHPYRQTIDALFSHRVVVVDKEAALMGQGISPVQMHDNLTIFVLSAQSFIETIRVKKDKGVEQQKPRAFRENGNFIEHTHYYTHPEQLIDGADPTALIQVIAQQNPLVIVDESHNFKADLRVELLNNLNPRFILELTATPRDNSNIISFVDAMQLKRENMVKLPVVVENRNAPKDVLVNAIRMRNSLEQHAIEMEKQGGRYIRPIVLFQAQPKTDDDNITFDKIKTNLINFGIPESQIKIKTANKDELKGFELMSRSCEVRYIITVNALKEGWDCPFAYILATLANKNSRVDVEQILGRILRQPYTIQHQNPLLNLSYVFTSSNDFRDTVEKIILSLQKAGFSKKDFREATPVDSQKAPITIPGFFDTPQQNAGEEDKDNGIDLTEEESSAIKEQLQSSSQSEDIQNLQQQAEQMSEEYNKQIEKQTKSGELDPLAAITPKEMYYPINENYKEVAAGMNLPIFFTKTVASIFSDDEWIPLEKSMLTKGFDLSSKDASVDFTITRPSGVTIDVVESGDDYVPIRRNNQQAIDYIRQQYMDKSVAAKKDSLSKQIAYMIKLDNIVESDIKKYVDRVIANLDEDAIASLVDNLYLTRDAIQEKIEGLLKEYQKQVFQQWLNTGRIQLDGNYTFIDSIAMTKEELVGIDKGLYVAEETVNDFEYDVISAIADNPNVLFWHRNREKKDFCINGFINHYPDFIIRMKSGKTILVETKGDHLVNDDSKNKIWLGNKWADLAGNNYRYFMVFQTKEVEGAITVKQLLQYLNEL
ncbi:MAG: DEAD/DEAH box helicase family protein [Prevotella sp.]|nr:DEAD/DEAH box helicase family protein [Prevotella sp.]